MTLKEQVEHSQPGGQTLEHHGEHTLLSEDRQSDVQGQRHPAQAGRGGGTWVADAGGWESSGDAT